jgi:hypothetical protein
MSEMKTTTIALALALFLGGGRAWADGALRLEPVEAAGLVPTQVIQERTAGGLEVRGRLEKRTPRHGRILAHVEVVLLDAEGRELARHSAPLTAFGPTRRDPDWARFAARIDQVPEAAVTVRVLPASGSPD